MEEVRTRGVPLPSSPPAAHVLSTTGSRCLCSCFLQLGGDLVEVDDEDGDVVQAAALEGLPGEHLASVPRVSLHPGNIGNKCPKSSSYLQGLNRV